MPSNFYAGWVPSRPTGHELHLEGPKKGSLRKNKAKSKTLASSEACLVVAVGVGESGVFLFSTMIFGEVGEALLQVKGETIKLGAPIKEGTTEQGIDPGMVSDPMPPKRGDPAHLEVSVGS